MILGSGYLCFTVLHLFILQITSAGRKATSGDSTICVPAIPGCSAGGKFSILCDKKKVEITMPTTRKPKKFTGFLKVGLWKMDEIVVLCLIIFCYSSWTKLAISFYIFLLMTILLG